MAEKKTEFRDVTKFIALEEELIALKAERGYDIKKPLWVRIGDAIADYKEKKTAVVDRKKYIKLALCCGWICGAHRFYARHYISGILYLLFFWTGIPFAMTLIDLMIALPKQTDGNEKIYM